MSTHAVKKPASSKPLIVGVLVMVQPGEGSLELGHLVALANAATVALSILTG